MFDPTTPHGLTLIHGDAKEYDDSISVEELDAYADEYTEYMAEGGSEIDEIEALVYVIRLQSEHLSHDTLITLGADRNEAIKEAARIAWRSKAAKLAPEKERFVKAYRYQQSQGKNANLLPFPPRLLSYRKELQKLLLTAEEYQALHTADRTEED